MTDGSILRKAKIEDVEKIHKIINVFAAKDEMLPRSLSELYENIRDFFVYIQGKNEELVGCAALHIFWKDLAEIKSLAVKKTHQRKGIGKKLVLACIREARDLHIAKMFVLTYTPDFFEKCGFNRIDKKELPQKIWSECVKCHKFPDCGEVPLIIDLNKQKCRGGF